MSFSLAASRLPIVFRITTKYPVPLLVPQMWVKREKIESLRLPFPSLLPPLSGIAPELNQARLIWVQFQPELPQPFPQLLQKPICIFPILKSQHSIVSVAYDDHLPARHLPPPCLYPQIEYVV